MSNTSRQVLGNELGLSLPRSGNTFVQTRKADLSAPQPAPQPDIAALEYRIAALEAENAGLRQRLAKAESPKQAGMVDVMAAFNRSIKKSDSQPVKPQQPTQPTSSIEQNLRNPSAHAVRCSTRGF